MDFDNSGFLVGRRNASVNKLLLSLDITESVVEEAIEQKADLVISHHPVIFHKLGGVTDQGAGSLVLQMAENGIAAVCMHTNLDIAEGGVNDVLIRLLGAECEGSLDVNGCGRVGQLPEELSMPDFLVHCRRVLDAKGLRFFDAGKPVKRLAVMGGAGGDSVRDAWEKGCDTYVTADIKYHQFLEAQSLGLNLIDADHFSTENPIIPVLAEKLKGEFPDLDVRISERHHAIISFF